MSERLVNLILEMRDEMARIEVATDETNTIINTFLMRYCVHDVMTDYIDITPDKCITIRYCKNCGVTFKREA
jgi:hypothetical protein